MPAQHATLRGVSTGVELSAVARRLLARALNELAAERVTIEGRNRAITDIRSALLLLSGTSNEAMVPPLKDWSNL
jgi:hypothetical protein